MRNLAGVSTIACQRCRLRKTRCDRNLPKCRSCERANAPCLTTDPTSGRAVPRSYLSHLESRVKELETELAKRDDNNLDLGHVDSGSYLGESSGLTFSSILGAALKENLPDAQTLQTTPRNAPEMAHDVVLPSKQLAEQYIQVYFHEANPQMPILHREAFIKTHFEPVYGLLSPGTNLATDKTQAALEMVLEEPPPGSYYRLCVDTGNYAYPSVAVRRSLYFLYSVFAVGAASCQQEYAETLAESLHLTAMKYYKIVLSSPDRLEALQGVLLLGLYSVMRPAHPGIWHVVGTAMRMCQELGLHNERRAQDPALRDLCRRLFWCAYSLDRQISVYLGRPPGIPDYCIRTPFPSVLDDAKIPYRLTYDASALNTAPPIKEEHDETTPGGPSYKRVALAIFKLRRIQGETQSILYDGREVPRRFRDLDEWRESILEELEAWWRDVGDTESYNCQFNINYLLLNYHQTRILLFGVSPGNPRPSEVHMLIIAHAGLHLIRTYSDIFAAKTLNYSWAAVHNIFLAGTSYLYVLYHSQSFRQKTSLTELETVVISALEVMDALKKYCDAAVACHRSFTLLSQAIIELVRRDKSVSASSPGYSDGDNDSIVSFLNNAADVSANAPGVVRATRPPRGTPGGTPGGTPTLLPSAPPTREQSQSPFPPFKPRNPPHQPQRPPAGQPSEPLSLEEPEVYDFLNEMQQSFIWNNFLNQSTQPQGYEQEQEQYNETFY